jgi:uncharacterized protein YgiM (DUF1202 family)
MIIWASFSHVRYLAGPLLLLFVLTGCIDSSQPVRTPVPTPPYDAMVDDDNIEVRSGPGLDYPATGKYERGTPLRVGARDRGGEWLYVSVDRGPEGWVMKQQLRVLISLTSLPIAGVPPLPMSTSTP